jgi:hypothetical protein
LKQRTCQSCGMPLQKEEDHGTSTGESKSDEYCFHCFQNGEFLDEGLTLEEKINKNVKFTVQIGMSEHEARKTASNVLPKLKRWKKQVKNKKGEKHNPLNTCSYWSMDHSIKSVVHPSVSSISSSIGKDASTTSYSPVSATFLCVAAFANSRNML